MTGTGRAAMNRGKGGNVMARRAPRQRPGSYTIIVVLGVVALLAVVGGAFIYASSKPYRAYTQRHPQERKTGIADDLEGVELDDPSYVPENLPPEQRAYQLLYKARKQVCIKDLEKAISMCEEALRIAPAHAGDVYFSMGMCHTERAIINKLPYAEQNEAGRKKIELYRRAIEAYGQAGAKTFFQERMEQRIGRIKTSMKMEKNATEYRQNCINSGVLAPPAGRR